MKKCHHEKCQGDLPCGKARSELVVSPGTLPWPHRKIQKMLPLFSLEGRKDKNCEIHQTFF